MNFSERNRAAMGTNPPGAPADSYVPPANPAPPPMSSVYSPPMTERFAQPRPSQPSQPPAPVQTWVNGVPNWITGLTALAVGYAGWKVFYGEKRT